MVIIKSHGVQINTDLRKIEGKPYYGSSLTCLRKHKPRTATERFFTMDKVQQNKKKERNFTEDRIWENYQTHIWSIVFSSPTVTKSKILIWKKTVPWELFGMFENNTTTATERFSTHGREKGKLYKTRARMTG